MSVSLSQTAMHVHLCFVFTAITPDTEIPFMRMAADTSHLCLKVRSTLHVTGDCSVLTTSNTATLHQYDAENRL